MRYAWLRIAASRIACSGRSLKHPLEMANFAPMHVARTFAFHTLGCKLNFSESSALARELSDEGYRSVDFDQPADIYVINTCSVTENADRECRRIVHRALRQNPEATVVVTGCYAQLKPQDIAAMEGVDLVLGASEKFRLASRLRHFIKKEKAEVHSCEISQVLNFTSAYSAGDRTRTFLKIQDGCDYTCSYCTIPLARGVSRSDTVAHVVTQAGRIAAAGVKEIVLTGVNIGDFRDPGTNGSGRGGFLELIHALDQVEGIERIRISSIEPNLLSDEIIACVAASGKFVPHFHIPLQSGSNRTLKRMRRRYLRERYAGRVERIRALLPAACIGADVIVGFPGESEEDFLESCRFIEDLDVNYLHVFTYSERARTDAATMEEPVPVPVRKQRNSILRLLSEKKLRAFYTAAAGQILPVLFESDNKDGTMHGFTPNYIRVSIPYRAALVNRCLDVRLTGIAPDGSMACEPVEAMMPA
jgi:threonylcarbamoyladenosine tRNA methylthiotransferase MtaB